MSNLSKLRLWDVLLRKLRPLGLTFILLVILSWNTDPSFAELLPNSPNAPGKISGTVTNESGIPLHNIYVRLFRYPFDPYYGDISTTTDENGKYSFLGLNSGVYKVGFVDYSKTYGPQYWQDTDSYCNAHEISLIGSNKDDINAILHPGSVITGSLVLSPSMRLERPPLVTLYQQCGDDWREVESTFSDFPTNQFIIRGLSNGTYRVCSTFSDFMYSGCYGVTSPLTPTITLLDATDITLTAGITVSNLKFSLFASQSSSQIPEGPGISGQVTSVLQEPLPGIKVILTPQDGGFSGPRSASTDSNGRYFFHLGGFPYAEDMVISFVDWFGDFQHEFYKNSHTLSDTVMIHYQPDDRILNIDAQLEKSAKVTGKIRIVDGAIPEYPRIHLFQQIGNQWQELTLVDAYYSPSVPNSVYTVFNYDRTTGIYSLAGLREGTYRIGAEQGIYYLDRKGIDGYFGGGSFEEAISFQLSSGDVHTDTEIVLGINQFEGVIQGQVKNEKVALEGIKVEFFHDKYAPPFLYTLTNSSGTYSVTGLANGTYYVRFSDPDMILAQEYYSSSASIISAQPLTVTGPTTYNAINAQMVQGGEISGVFTLQNNEPIRNASVYLFRVKRGEYFEHAISNTVTDNSGRFSFKPLLPGNYQIAVYYFIQNTSYSGIYDEYNSETQMYVPKDIPVQSGKTTEIEKRFGTFYIYLPTIAK